MNTPSAGGAGTLGDGWRLAVGTLTAWPVGAPRAITPPSARAAVLLAPVAVVPLGAAVALVLWLGAQLGLPSLACGFLAVLVLALGSRALHWDGVSDVADGLTASYDTARSLAVMRSGSAGPAGVVAVVLLAGLQAACLAAYAGQWWRAAVAGGLVCLSRCALWVSCARWFSAARPGGLGATFASTVPTTVAALGILALAVVPGMVVLALVRRCTTRFGGVTGDVFGASVEVALAALLVCFSWL